VRLKRILVFPAVLFLFFCNVAQVAAKADLTPYQPSLWNDKIPIGIAPLTGDDAHTYSGPYTSDKFLYINWASYNQGNFTANNYTIHLEITGTGGGSWSWTSSTPAHYYTYMSTDLVVGPLAIGSHTFKLWLDYTNVVSESNETNNYYERTIDVISTTGAEIHGVKFNDLNRNGVQDSGESGLPGWRIYLDLNADGLWDNNEPNTLTDSSGRYAFTNLSPGTYIVAEVPQAGWQQSFPAAGIALSTTSAIKSLAADQSLPAITTTGSSDPIYTFGEIADPLSGEIYPLLAESGPLIGMDQFRSDPRFTGVNGAGYAAVILDTGIDLNHPFFGPDADSNGIADRIVYQHDYANNDNDATDHDGHGSNVAGIVASQDSTYTGMAPGCNIIALKVFTDSGVGNFSYIESALQWVNNNAEAYNIVSINMSLGDSGNYDVPTIMSSYGITDELANLAAKNIIVVAASGNSFYNYNSEIGVSYPAADPHCLSIGAVYDANAGSFSYGDGSIANTTGPNRICPFSQRHPDLTTVFAPGAPITSANASGGTVTMHGTSQASPHIAGIAVLAQQLAQIHLGRKLTPVEFINILRATGVTINDGDDEDDNVTNTGLNFPRVNMPALAGMILAMAQPNIHSVTLASGQIAENIDFGNYLLICGDWGYAPADVDKNCYVDVVDLDLIAQHWLESPCSSGNSYCNGADVNQNGSVDLDDFAVIALNWLVCSDPQNAACSNFGL
jgi:subtilisin family serine protease